MCRTWRKPCKNKAESAHQQTAAPNVPQAMNEEQLISEEEEARLENQRVAEFINTLDEEMAKKLAIRALQKGVGSMDFVDSLPIMETEDDDSTDQEHDVAGDGSPVRVPQASKQSIDQEPVPEWCKCSCCRTMTQDIENKCCNRRNCTSQTRRFCKLCLDAEYLQLCAKNTADIRNDRQDSSTHTFRKAAYRNFILDTHGYLGKRKVVPSFPLGLGIAVFFASEALSLGDWCIYGFSSSIGHL
ncbi:uncharacterized protein LOC144642315 [Oculina patagonica]